MERIIKLFLAMVMILSTITSFSQQVRLVIDAKAIKQATENQAWQLAAEVPHNQLLDTIYSLQSEIVEKTGAIASIKWLHKQSLQNTKGFDPESSFYKDIAKTATDIIDMTPDVIYAVLNSSFVNQANSILKIGELSNQCSQLVNDFINIVNNGKIKNPLLNTSSASSVKNSDDGANMLDRDERLKIATKICYDLKSVKAQLNRIKFLCSYGDWTNLIQEVDKESWAKVNRGKDIADELIKQWRNTK